MWWPWAPPEKAVALVAALKAAGSSRTAQAGLASREWPQPPHGTVAAPQRATPSAPGNGTDASGAPGELRNPESWHLECLLECGRQCNPLEVLEAAELPAWVHPAALDGAWWRAARPLRTGQPMVRGFIPKANDPQERLYEPACAGPLQTAAAPEMFGAGGRRACFPFLAHLGGMRRLFRQPHEDTARFNRSHCRPLAKVVDLSGCGADGGIATRKARHLRVQCWARAGHAATERPVSAHAPS